jgi:ATP-dependent Clp protease protease subunit
MSKIYITGDITIESFSLFSKKLSKQQGAIDIELISEGGEAIAALAYFDKIKRYRNVTITAYGIVASAAVLILAAGTKRRMARNAWIMVHEDSESCEESRTVMELERDAKHYRRLENQWAEILSSVSKTSIDKWIELHKNETYLSAQECLELGLIEEII